ncbi:receptor-type guanylate cyclase Gyc76C [Parasteatoda tepidariorum]|uniref:receptor-type guanylate cyclase Gyc76C n=1 Tax=Parasteatoda tepidariorum TaxID=114398 RepID=UPI00077FB773|nr:receptor-type guanylate cyclase Gyc76C [Parasteatoda tepidariorum]
MVFALYNYVQNMPLKIENKCTAHHRKRSKGRDRRSYISNFGLLEILKLILIILIVLLSDVSAEIFTVGYLTNIHGRENPQKQGLVISGAISYALDHVNNNASILKGHKLRLIYNDTEGDTLQGTKIIIQQWREGAVAFFGPEDSCGIEATVAASLNLPIISYKCSESRIFDKNFYKTFARTNPSDKGVVRSILALLKYYRWRKFSILSEENNPYMTVAQSLEKQVSSYPNFTINHKGIKYIPNLHVCCEDKKPCCTDNFSKVVEETYKTTRVYVFFGRLTYLIELLTKLQMKLLDIKDYVIVYIHLEQYSVAESYQYFWRVDMRPYLKEMAMKAAKSLLVIVPSPPHDKGYHDFEEKVRNYNFEEPFKFPNNLPYPKHITEFAAYLYDSVILYAEALAKTLEEKEDPRNGTFIIQKIIEKEVYRSVTGAWMHIDTNGDVEGNYTVLALQQAPPNLTLKGIGRGKNLSHLMLPMAIFQYDGGTGESVFTLLDVDIHWEAPLDEPPCGFNGKGCYDPPSHIREIFTGVLAFILLVVCVASWIMYKKWKYEQEICGLLWKIPLEDIQRYGSTGILSAGSKMSIRSEGSLESKLTGQTFTHTALYKGTLVATKTLKFKSRNIDIPRVTKKEMKTMRELHHDNINPFIGACVLPHYIILVTEYCAKGSLKDILENPDIKLDHMFIASLVFDLIKGMIFLHDSDLKVHGNLKSSNCVVTSRWVLQITDYGLRELCTAAEDEIFLNYDHYRKMLWKAPEVLRQPSRYPKGTQKGDVYSFAIILHEIILRRGPFGNKLPAEEIITRVQEGPDKIKGDVFRPSLEDVDVQDYILHTMNDCWSENPEQRPDFRHIKEKLKRMKDGMTSNIMDNMMDMMERYANNLEDLVEERTSQLAEEQRKTEALLHRMLPKSVAEQLMRGEAVIPESFDAVTIYFSDIVGFTEMSATSTPMEVVTFLNDLYTVFDSIISSYDVYKVETIGDAYMVVSGLPIRNGNQHAIEIASMALELIEAVKTFRIRHKPNQSLQLRVGIHTGPVVAGVVGLTMPRYCLFGDTVNTASRMESTGEALMIHLSDDCRVILEESGGYDIVSRGFVNVKGKGDLLTYWLEGYKNPCERRKNAYRGFIQPQAIFNILDSENRKRSPKTEFLRRIPAAQAHRSLEDSVSLFNGSVPGKGNLLKVAQDSPLVKKRSGLAQTVVKKDTFQSDPWDGNESGCNVAFNIANPDALDNTNNATMKLSTSTYKLSPTEHNKIVGVDHDISHPVTSDDVKKPLLLAEERLAYLKKLKGKYQPWRRSWSADIIDQPKERKHFLPSIFQNAPHFPDSDSKRTVGPLHTLKESDTEESVV